MDPLSALGLASSILQCLQFVGSLISQSREIYKSVDGATEEVISFRDMARNLAAINQDLISRPSQSDETRLSKAEKRLRQLCEESKSINEEVLATLEHLQLKGSRTGWDSFKRALNSAWKKSEVDALQKRLDGIRKELDTTLLISVRYLP